MTFALFPRKPYIVIFLETSRGRGNCQLLAQIWTGTKKVEKVGPGQHLAQKFQKHVGGPKKFSPHKKGHCKQCWLSQLLARKSRKHVGTKNFFLPDWACWLCKKLAVPPPSTPSIRGGYSSRGNCGGRGTGRGGRGRAGKWVF